jgi:branched-chain amino acid transport system permease protein
MDARVADALFNGSVLALLASSITVVLDLFGFVNIAVPASFILGSATAFAFAVAGSPEWQWIAAGALVGLVGGIAIDRLALDPLRRRGRALSMLPASIAATLIVYGLVREAFSPGVSVVPHVVILSRVATIGGFTFTALQAFSVALTVVACALLDFAVRRTRFGNGVRAACANPLAAQLMGMRIDRVPAAAMGLTCALSSAAGALSTVRAEVMTSSMPAMVLLEAIAVVALAPVGSVGGACLIAYGLSIAAALVGANFASLPAFAMPCAMLALIALGLGLRQARVAAPPAVVEP